MFSSWFQLHGNIPRIKNQLTTWHTTWHTIYIYTANTIIQFKNQFLCKKYKKRDLEKTVRMRKGLRAMTATKMERDGPRARRAYPIPATTVIFLPPTFFFSYFLLDWLIGGRRRALEGGASHPSTRDLMSMLEFF